MNNTKKSAFLRKRILFGAPEPVSEEKTVNNCFFKRCPTKQGAEGASVSSDAQRLCGSDVRTHVSNVGLECGGSHKRKTAPFGVASLMRLQDKITTRGKTAKIDVLLY